MGVTTPFITSRGHNGRVTGNKGHSITNTNYALKYAKYVEIPGNPTWKL